MYTFNLFFVSKAISENYLYSSYLSKKETTYIQETVLSKVKEIEKLIEFYEERTLQGPFFEYFKSNFYKNNSFISLI